jgi:peptidoglycan-associated lipoprotein
MRRTTLAVLIAGLAGLHGCATTESQQAATPAAVPAPAAPSSSASTGSRSTGQVTGGTVGRTTGGGTDRPDLKKSVYYEFDKYDVKAEYRALVESHAAWLKANPNAKLVVEGNADERGSREYNVALGQRRAESVTKLMVLMGARADQIEAVSWGEEKPRGTGHDETSWSENRRSDFASR